MALVQQEISKNHHTVRGMFASIAPRYDMGNTVLSMGIHHLWRRRLIQMIPDSEKARCILDMCTGTGDLLPLIQRRFPGDRVLGADFCFPMLEEAHKKCAVEQTPILQADALQLPFADNSLDIITVAFGVRNFESTEAGLKELHRVLLPGGTLLVLEFGQPEGLFGHVYRWYSRVIMPVIGGLVTGNRDAYQYLPETAARFPAEESFCKLLTQTGFARSEFSRLTMGIACIYRGSKAL